MLAKTRRLHGKSLSVAGAALALWGCGSNAEAPIGNFPAPPVAFEDATENLSGFTHSVGDAAADQLSGVAWFDYDGDAWLDFYVANGKGDDDGSPLSYCALIL